ncbi:MAG: hypothetical protein QXI12_04370 [Candidatus Methanomethyliaceae archaeon]
MKAKLFPIFLLFMLLLPCGSAFANPDPLFVDTGGLSAMIQNPTSDGVFYANGLYWIFTGKNDSSRFGYYYSTDGMTWSSWRPLAYANGTPIGFEYDASVCFDGQKVMIAGNIYPNGLFYIQGTPLGNGSIAWDWEAFQVSDLIGSLIDVARRSDGKPVVSFVYMWSVEPRNYTGYIYVCWADDGAGAWERKASIPDAYELAIAGTSSGTIYAIARNDTQINYYALFSNGTLHFYFSAPDAYRFGFPRMVSYNDTVFTAYGSNIYGQDTILVLFLNESFSDYWQVLFFNNNTLNSTSETLADYALAYDSYEKALYIIYTKGETSTDTIAYVNWTWMKSLYDVVPVDAAVVSRPFDTLIASGVGNYALAAFTTYESAEDYLYFLNVAKLGYSEPPPPPSTSWHIVAYDTWILFPHDLTHSGYSVDNPSNNTYYIWYQPVLNATYEVSNNPYTYPSFGLSARQCNVSVEHVYWDIIQPSTTLYPVPFATNQWTYVRAYYNSTPPKGVELSYTGHTIVPEEEYFRDYGAFLKSPIHGVYVNYAQKYVEIKFKTSGADPFLTGDDRYKVNLLWTIGDWYYKPGGGGGGADGQAGGSMGGSGAPSGGAAQILNQTTNQVLNAVGNAISQLPEALQLPATVAVVGLPVILLLLFVLLPALRGGRR